MKLEVLGAGFGRTGTASLAAALEQLGYEKCYHMSELAKHPEHAPVWEAAHRGEAVHWDVLFEGYRAAVDWPVSAFYKQLLELNANAKVILTTRNADEWYESARDTIYARRVLRMGMPNPRAAVSDYVIWDGVFQRRFEERDFALKVYDEHIAEVRRVVPKERLLEFDVKQGWHPLCAFLCKPVPANPFPRVNDKASFQDRTEQLYMMVKPSK